VNEMSVKNGVSAISSEVLGDIQKEAEAIISAAENEAKETLKAAKHEADQKYRDMISHAKVKAEAERRKIASVTEVDLRNRLLQTKEDLVDVAFAKALAEFKNFVETDEYHGYLIKLIENTAKKIGQNDLVIQVNSRDAAWLTQEQLKTMAKKLHSELKLAETTEQFIGGCIIQTADGKIIYDSTIDTRLEELKPTLRVEVAKILFGEV
jgi:V/A-type H+/Na+-transporting ATPase subunit E